MNFSAQETYSKILTFNIYGLKGEIVASLFGAEIWRVLTYLKHFIHRSRFQKLYSLVKRQFLVLIILLSCNLQMMNTCKYPSHSWGTTNRQFYSEQVQGCGRIVLLHAEMVYFPPQPLQLYQVETLD